MSIPRSEIRAIVSRIVSETPLVDMHTHLYPPSFGGLLLWGIDELLTYHYLIAEVLRATRLPYNEFWKMPKDKQADLIWQKL
ncbi:MAG: glucuronate isomerase, partial [Anaerolineae bacterium]|nr:glucuronate isomerase [Anaerolineae bacterium]